MATHQCSRCSTQLSRDVVGGLCPACLLEAGIGAYSDATLPPDQETPAPAARRGNDDGAATGSLKTFGDYELLGEIARGGQGVVYRARHATLRRDVALKMFPLHPWTSAADLERFRVEARIAAQLDHPAIVPIYEIGEVQGQHFFTMKLIDGTGLDRLPAAGEIAPRRAAEIIAEVARALDHAHARGVLHRDIKPGNILLDAAGRPHVTDFGLAKLFATESTLTRTRELLGTPSYISPEAAAGDARELSAATDVYGLGATLYFLLTGSAPFAGGTTLETVRQVIAAEPRKPRAWNPKVDRDLETICLKCLEKEPARRYRSAADLADDLDRWMRHEPIRARPGSLAYRGQKWLRRHAVAASIATAAVCSIAAIFWSVRQTLNATAPAYSLGVLVRPADSDSSYLAAEFSRNLIHLLGTLPSTQVAPRSAILLWEKTSTSPQTIGKALHVPVLATGTVQQSAGLLRFKIDLIEIASGRTLWSKTHEAPLAEGAEIQTQVVRAIAAALNIALTGENRHALQTTLTVQPEAWSHYLRARQLADSPSETTLQQAIGEFERALALDPNFAQAYAGLADVHLDLGYTFREPAAHFALAKKYVREALQRDETLAEAIVADGVLKFFCDWDWPAAEHAVQQAMLLDPSTLENHACYLHCLQTTGQGDAALKMVRAAAAAHPTSVMIQAELGCSAYYAGKFGEAETYSREVLTKDPDNFYLRWALARTLTQERRYAEAERELLAAQGKPGGDWTAIASELAFVLARTGRTEEARRVIEGLRTRSKREFVDPYLFAMAYAGLDETDAVFRELRLAANVRSSWIPSLPVDPKFAGLKGDRRYGELLAQLKLPVQ